MLTANNPLLTSRKLMPVCVCVCVRVFCTFTQEEMLLLTFHKFDLDLNQALNIDEFTEMCTALLEMRKQRQKKT
jgi:hypothetical protein